MNFSFPGSFFMRIQHHSARRRRANLRLLFYLLITLEANANHANGKQDSNNRNNNNNNNNGNQRSNRNETFPTEKQVAASTWSEFSSSSSSSADVGVVSEVFLTEAPVQALTPGEHKQTLHAERKERNTEDHSFLTPDWFTDNSNLESADPQAPSSGRVGQTGELTSNQLLIGDASRSPARRKLLKTPHTILTSRKLLLRIDCSTHKASMLNSAVINGKVSLPCDISPATPDDSVALILWYKDDSLAPIYTIDARKAASFERARMSLDETYANRANFNVQSKPAQLELEQIRQEDEGEYRCRVDFKRGRTVNTIIALRVLVPPLELRIISSEKPNTKLNGLIGPFSEGFPLSLICLVQGGKPRPQVNWRRDFNVIDDTYEHLDKEVTSNELKIQALSKNHLLSIFTCQASNSNLTAPLQASITLDLNLKPQEITLRQTNPVEPLIVGQQATFECLTQGSRPQANIYWLFQGARHETPMTVDQQQTLARWTLTVQKSFNQEPLTCVAENPRIPGSSAIKQTVKLDVHYPPQLSIKLDPPLESPAQEGNDIYLYCHLDANPKPIKPILWRFKGKPLQANSQLIINNHSLVLRKVSRHQSGSYTCEATNSQGFGSSQPMDLLIRHAPVCASDDILVYEAGIGQTVYIDCEVIANPASSVHYSWFLSANNPNSPAKNLSSWVRRDASLDEQIDESGSRLKLRLSGESALIKCKAKNEIGLQQRACLFQVTEARQLPSLEHSCSLGRNISSSSSSNVHIICRPSGSPTNSQTPKQVEEAEQPASGWQLGLDAASRAVASSSFLSDGYSSPETRLRTIYPPTWYLIELYKGGSNGKKSDSDQESSGGFFPEQPVVARFIVGAGAQLAKIRLLIEENKLLLFRNQTTGPPIHYLSARSVPESFGKSSILDQQFSETLNPNRTFGFTIQNLEASQSYKLLIHAQNLAGKTRDWQLIQVETGAQVEGTSEQVASQLVGANLIAGNQQQQQTESSSSTSIQKSIVMRSDSTISNSDSHSTSANLYSSSSSPERNETSLSDGAPPQPTRSLSSGGFLSRSMGGAARLSERWQEQVGPYVDVALNYARQKPLLAVPALVSATLLLVLLAGCSGTKLVRMTRRGSRAEGGKRSSSSLDLQQPQPQNLKRTPFAPEVGVTMVQKDCKARKRVSLGDEPDLLKQHEQKQLELGRLDEDNKEDEEEEDEEEDDVDDNDDDDDNDEGAGQQPLATTSSRGRGNSQQLNSSALLASSAGHQLYSFSQQPGHHLAGSLDRQGGLYLDRSNLVQLQMSQMGLKLGTAANPVRLVPQSLTSADGQQMLGSLDRRNNYCSAGKLFNKEQHYHQQQQQQQQPHHHTVQHQHLAQLAHLEPTTYLALANANEINAETERMLSELANSCSYNSGSFSSTESGCELHSNFKGKPRVAFDLSHQQSAAEKVGTSKQVINLSVMRPANCNSSNKGSDTSNSLNTAGDSGLESPLTAATLIPETLTCTNHRTYPTASYALIGQHQTQHQQQILTVDHCGYHNGKANDEGNQLLMLIAPQGVGTGSSSTASPLMALDDSYDAHKATNNNLRYLCNNHQMATSFTTHQNTQHYPHHLNNDNTIGQNQGLPICQHQTSSSPLQRTPSQLDNWP